MTGGLGLLVIMKFTEWYKDANPDKPSIFDSRKDGSQNYWKHEPLIQRLARVMPRLKLGCVTGLARPWDPMNLALNLGSAV